MARKTPRKVIAADLMRGGRGEKVHHPAHYNAGRFETIDVMEDVAQHYLPVEAVHVAEVLRYLGRAPLKGDKKTDVRKAKWYLDRLAARLA